MSRISKIFLIVLVFTFVFINNVKAQEDIKFIESNFSTDVKTFKEIYKELQKGNYYFDKNEYSKALLYYLKADEYNSFSAELNYKIGVCYLYMDGNKDLHKYLKKAYFLNPNVSNNINFMLGWSYQLNTDWDKALVEFKKQMSISLEGGKGVVKEDLVKRHIEQCYTGKKLMTFPVDVEIENLGGTINSEYPEYSPVLNGDESVIYFTSRRNTTTGGNKSTYDFMYYEDILKSESNSEGDWSIPENIGPPLNTPTNDATVALTFDGRKMIIYKDINGGDLFISSLGDEKWSKPIAFPKTINSRYHESFASLSSDGNTLFFVSDNPDNNFGGKDIFYSVRNKEGYWDMPINIGPEINTPFDEAGVFMHPDGKTLYFSSTGHKTMGGYDIFKSTFNPKINKWTSPINLGYPINTPNDDIFVSISANAQRIYYSSANREGYGSEDLYRINYLSFQRDVILNNEENLITSIDYEYNLSQMEMSMNSDLSEVKVLTYYVKDDESKRPLTANVEIYNVDNGDVLIRTRTNRDGKFIVALPSGKNYGMAIIVDGYLFHSENFDIAEGEKFEKIEEVVSLKKVEAGKGIELRNIFFDFDKSTLRKESITEIKRVAQLMTDYPSMRVQLSGHTDHLGPENYNQILSENRAKSVYYSLINDFKIDKSRLEYVGFGESKPIAPNLNTDGSDNPEGRQKNRRTEFFIISM